MKNSLRSIFALMLMSTLLFTSTSCKDDDPEPGADGELITMLKITLVPVGKTQTVVGTFSDPDGPGGNQATVSTMRLEANTTYNATVTLFDESKTPAVELTQEIQTEADEHELFYQALNNLVLSVTKTDKDKAQRPIGLKAQVVTSGKSSGTLRITLKHQPNNLKVGANDPNREQTGLTRGETDVQADFPVIVE